jgi:glycosyltransferase involved in cell wall biosynthesis
MNSEPKTNIIIWANSNNIGGVESWVITLKKALASSSYNPILISDGSKIAQQEKTDIIVSSWSQTEDILKNLSPALVIPNYRYPVFGICAKLRKQGYKLSTLGICHADSYEEYYEPLNWYESAIDAFMAVSPVCTKNLIEHIPHRRQNIHYIPYAIEIDKITDKQYSIDPLRLVYFGRIEQKQKRVLDLIELVKSLKREEVNYRFDVIGSGADKDKLKKGLKKADSNDCVKLLGELPHTIVLNKLEDYDVFLQVSEYEGQSISMLEAMASKLIVCVTRDRSGSWHLINDEDNGFCCDLADMQSMAKTIKKISYMEEKKIRAIGQAAFATVKSKYSIENLRPKYLQLFEKCLNAPNKKWQHNKRYIMPGGFSSRYFPKNKMLGYILHCLFKIIPRYRIREILSR